MWPAQKFNPTRRTPASSRAIMNSSTSASDGVGSPSKGHQNSTSVNPAAAAAAGRSLTGSSVSKVEQFSTKSAGEKFRRSDCWAEKIGRASCRERVGMTLDAVCGAAESRDQALNKKHG